MIRKVDMLRRTIKGIARSLGYQIERIDAGIHGNPFNAQKALVPTPAIIFDVGAHFGETAAHYREHFPTASIYSFEPFPDSFAKLSAATSSDRLTTCIPLAVSNFTSSATLKVNRAEATNSLLATDSSAQGIWGDGVTTMGEVTVSTVCLDDFCSTNQIEHIDILKMDVQGGEFDALLGAKRMLVEKRIGMIYMEMIFAPTYVGQHAFSDYLSLLERVGYRMVDMFNLEKRHGRLVQADVLFGVGDADLQAA